MVLALGLILAWGWRVGVRGAAVSVRCCQIGSVRLLSRGGGVYRVSFGVGVVCGELGGGWHMRLVCAWLAVSAEGLPVVFPFGFVAFGADGFVASLRVAGS